MEEEGEEREEQSVTPFDYSAIDIHTEETPTEEASDAVTPPTDTYPDVATVSETDAVPDAFAGMDGVKTQEPGDQTATRTTTMTPYSHSVSSPAPTTKSGPVLPGVSQPVTDGLSTYDDMEGSANRGTDDEIGAMQEGSADDVLPTPAAGSQSSVMTDETELGGTELPTFIPETTPQETTTQSLTDDFEGSASGEDEASGQDVYPPEIPRLTSTLPPISTLHTQQPEPAVGTEVTIPVVLPDTDPVTEAGSGAEQLSGQGEVSGEQGGLVDLPREVIITVLPDVAAVTSGEQTTPTTDTKDPTSEPSTPKYSTPPSFAVTDDKKHPTFTTEPAPTTPEDHTSSAPELSTPQAEQSTTTSKPHTSQPTFSTTSPLYTFDHNTNSVPQWALIPDPAATPLPEGDVHYDREMVPLLEVKPQMPDKIEATEQPDVSTDSIYSVEANTVDIRGKLLVFGSYSGVNVAITFFF